MAMTPFDLVIHEARLQLAKADSTVDPHMRRLLADQAIYTLLRGIGYTLVAEEWREIKALAAIETGRHQRNPA